MGSCSVVREQPSYKDASEFRNEKKWFVPVVLSRMLPGTSLPPQWSSCKIFLKIE